MSGEFQFDSDGTKFSFCVTSRGENDCGYFWTDAVLRVSNSFFHYRTSPSCFELGDLENIENKLSDLLNGKITKIETMEFLEPDLKIVLKPEHDIRNDGKYDYIKPGNEIEDIKAEFMLFPFINNVMTEQYYLMPLYREDIEGLVNYLAKALPQLE